MRGPRRIVTGHDTSGRSVVVSDVRCPRPHAIPGAVFHEIWSTREMPVSIGPTEPTEPTKRPLVTPPDAEGTVVRLVDLLPRSRSPMHRTESIDYGVVLDGEVSLLLDDGSETQLEPGDVVVQRGTDHAWLNASDRVARVAFVLIDGRFTDELRALLADEPELLDRPLDR